MTDCSYILRVALLSCSVVTGLCKVCKVALHVGQLPPAGKVPGEVVASAVLCDGGTHCPKDHSKGAFPDSSQ